MLFAKRLRPSMSVEWFGEQLAELPHEYERVIPPPGKTLTFTVSGWRLGFKTVHIKPNYAPRDKVAIGLDINRLDKPDAIHKWALLGAEPVAHLEAELTNAPAAGQVFSIALRGKAPAQHWIIGVSSAEGV